MTLIDYTFKEELYYKHLLKDDIITFAESLTSALLWVKAPAVFAKFITDSVDNDVAPLPTPYVARREQEEWREVKEDHIEVHMHDHTNRYVRHHTISHKRNRYIMLFYSYAIISYHIMSCHVMSYHVMWCDAIKYDAI